MKQEILEQLEIGWQLFTYHCRGLGEEEAMWCQSSGSLQVRNTKEGWVADWPETEAYIIGPPSIAWILWHMLYWWKTTLTASKEGRIMEKEEVKWPGTVEAAIGEMQMCHDEWISFLASLDERELRADDRCCWPFEGKSMCTLALWLNMEFMKNTAEIGAGRFLFATTNP